VRIPPPRASAPVPNARAKELLDQKKDWLLANPDGSTTPSKPEDLLSLPEYGSKRLICGIAFIRIGFDDFRLKEILSIVCIIITNPGAFLYLSL
jgi:hypothetical protein